MHLSGYYKESINEGYGLRSVLFISGCLHACKGCFNEAAWDFKYGEEFTLEKQLKVINDIKNNPLIDGLTLCGGDPFFSPKEVIEFLKLCKLHIPNINVWAYSGFKYEEILRSKLLTEMLGMCDVLIDGRFVLEEKDTTLLFRGSKNQRIIDIQESLKNDCIKLLTK